MTKEHVWPKWLRQCIDGSPTEAYVAEGGDQPKRIWYGPVANLTIKRVCSPCNSGWMSQLESAAKLVLRPMLDGEPRELSDDERALLSRWAIKTATACDLASGSPHAPQELRTLIRSADSVPPGIHVLLARYAGHRYPLYSGGWTRTMTIDVGGAQRRQRVLMLTICVGTVVFQVFGHGISGLRELAPAGAKRDYARVLWPAHEVCVWPLPTPLGDAGLRQFAEAL